MPLNEASARPSNLTRRQRQEALAAIYGIPPALSEAEADELRERLSGDDPEND